MTIDEKCNHEKVSYLGMQDNFEGDYIPLINCLNCKTTTYYQPYMKVIYGRDIMFTDLNKVWRDLLEE